MQDCKTMPYRVKEERRKAPDPGYRVPAVAKAGPARARVHARHTNREQAVEQNQCDNHQWQVVVEESSRCCFV